MAVDHIPLLKRIGFPLEAASMKKIAQAAQTTEDDVGRSEARRAGVGAATLRLTLRARIFRRLGSALVKAIDLGTGGCGCFAAVPAMIVPGQCLRLRPAAPASDGSIWLAPSSFPSGQERSEYARNAGSLRQLLTSLPVWYAI